MTDMLEMPKVSECTVTGCGYNHDGCHAFAITIGRDAASCDTFFDTSSKGGLDRVIAQVGACKRTDCTYNSDMECGAPAIRVAAGKDIADCQTYSPR